MYSESPFLQDEVRDYLAENPHAASAYKVPKGSVISEEEEEVPGTDQSRIEEDEAPAEDEEDGTES